MPEDTFFVRTLTDGPALKLGDPRLLAAVREMKPVVVLDSAIRFNQSDDENSSSGNKVFSADMFRLIHAGARGVIANHHSTKVVGRRSKRGGYAINMTLENMLRGTGDLAATADAVYGLRSLCDKKLHLEVQCLKPRDFEKPANFEIQGRPYLNEMGDFALLGAKVAENVESESGVLEKFLLANERASYRDIEKATRIPTARVKELTTKIGWLRDTDDMEDRKARWIAPSVPMPFMEWLEQELSK
jgi:hypothetical protein